MRSAGPRSRQMLGEGRGEHRRRAAKAEIPRPLSRRPPLGSTGEPPRRASGFGGWPLARFPDVGTTTEVADIKDDRRP